jgi:hypothetical protein
MEAAPQALVDRMRKLGLVCDHLALDRLESAVAALACFPMYMIANVHAWTDERQFRVPILDLPGFEHIREAFVIGKAEAQFEIDPAHRAALGTLLAPAKPADRIIYDYALETLADYLRLCDPDLANAVRGAVARMCAAVARAAGKGLLGSGPKVSPAERACLAEIDHVLALTALEEAALALSTLDGA